MKTNWREVRKSLAGDEAFNTFSTIDRRDLSGRNLTNEGEEMVKSTNSVERSPKASPPSQNTRAKSVKSAESPDNVLNSWEWIEERASILQFDGGLNRDEANAGAFLCWYRYFVEDECDG